jgi:site-specific recombinase XerD
MAKQKATPIASAGYILLIQGFTEWLQLLGYSPLGIPSLASAARDFLLYQETNGKQSLEQLEASDATNFILCLQNKVGERTKKPFTNNHINKQIQALKLFSRYIRETGKSSVGFALERLDDVRGKPSWLTKNEMGMLYNAVPETVLGIRDKAMLAVYYGCGLRLNEGANIELKDIDTVKKVLHVKKGKHYKERFVPIADKNFEEIKLYVDYARPQFLGELKTQALFIAAGTGSGGRPLGKQSLYLRIKLLVKKSGIKKKVGTHTLRHSIATHLLQSGMKLERIQQFLGHADLDSTQVYTHLKNEAT